MSEVQMFSDVHYVSYNMVPGQRMPPKRKRDPPKRYADAVCSARGRPAKRNRSAAASSTRGGEEEASNRQPSQRDTQAQAGTTPDGPGPQPSDNTAVQEGVAAILAELRQMKEGNAQLAARLTALEQQTSGRRPAEASTSTHLTGGPGEGHTVGGANIGQPSNLAEITSAAVDTTVNNLTGTLLQTVPIDLNISDKMRQSIIQGHFVEFAELLSPEKDKEFTLTVDDEGRMKMTSAPKQKRGRLLFTKWAEAWNIYTHVYTQAHTSKEEVHAGFSKHYETVSNLFHQGHDWEYYDRQFRTMIAKGLVQWGQKMFDISFEARQRSLLQGGKGNTPPTGPKSFQVPSGYCKLFHVKGNCRYGHMCKFSHACFHCGEKHTFRSCTRNRTHPFRGRPNRGAHTGKFRPGPNPNDKKSN